MTEDQDQIILISDTMQDYNKDFGIAFCRGGFDFVTNIDKEHLEKTVIIIDEAHEWKLEQEVLMGWINAYRESGNKIKLMMISATINPTEIESYYKNTSTVHTIELEGRQFEITTHKFYHESTKMDVIIQAIKDNKSCLVFCSGKKEINTIIDKLNHAIRFQNSLDDLNLSANILPLHGSLSFQDQQKIFEHSDNPKVIVATNIAQSGLTPPVHVVIDNGKEKRKEVVNGIETLVERPISRADREQRKGRTGRLGPGDYYLQMNDYDSEQDIPDYPVPEIQRLSLDSIVISLLAKGIDPLKLKFFHDPNKENIIATIGILKSFDLFKDGELTEDGMKACKLPLSIRNAKLIIEAEKHHCMQDMIKAVSIMEIGSLLNLEECTRNNRTYKNYIKSNISKKSDLLAEIELYDRICARHFPDLKKAYINIRNFTMIKKSVRKLRTTLMHLDYDINSQSSDSDDMLICILTVFGDSLIRSSYGCLYSEKNLDNIYFSAVSDLEYKSGLYASGLELRLERRNHFGALSVSFLSFATIFTKDEIMLLAPFEDLHTSINFEYFSMLDKAIHYSRNIMYYNIRIESLSVEVKEGDENYDIIYKKFQSEIEHIIQMEEIHEKRLKELRKNEYSLLGNFQLSSSEPEETEMSKLLKEAGFSVN